MKHSRSRQRKAGAAADQAAVKEQNEIKESPAGGVQEAVKAEQPRSWRQYIEENLPEQAPAAKAAVQPPRQEEKKPSKRVSRFRQEEKPAKQAVRPQQEEKPTKWAARPQQEEQPAKRDARPQREEQPAERAPRPRRERKAGADAQAMALMNQAKQGAGKAAQAGLAAAETGWKKAAALAAGCWSRVSQATQGVRGLVARHPISPLLYVTLLAVAVGVVGFRGTYIQAYALSVNGEDMGVVSSEEDVNAIVSDIESRASDILGEHFDYQADISTTQVYVTPDELCDTTEVADVLFDNVGVYIQAYGISVNGQELGYAATKDELYQMLDDIAQPYIPADAIRYEFVEDVQVYPVELPANTEFDTAPIWETLSSLEIEEATYEVKKGDTFNAIAYSLDMWPNELSVLNPDIIVDKLWVGQELIIQQAVPYLSVQVTTDETYEEVIPSPVEYIETADLYVGSTKVKEQGEDGLALVNAQVTYVNNVELDREIIQSTTLKEATTTYTYTGTTPRPATASNGYYIWPVRGTITSNFGSRTLWGSYDFHLGLDIACPMGTAIKAADGGTVIKAGWSGSYGYLVAIRHDNGTVTYYAHNSSILVSVGQKVYQGQIIAKAGMTGNASGPHCHFEVRVNGTSVNPRNYLQ